MGIFSKKSKGSSPKKGGKDEKKGKKTKERAAQRENIFAQKLDMTEDYKPPFYAKSDAAIEFIDGALGDNFGKLFIVYFILYYIQYIIGFSNIFFSFLL